MDKAVFGFLSTLYSGVLQLSWFGGVLKSASCEDMSCSLVAFIIGAYWRNAFAYSLEVLQEFSIMCFELCKDKCWEYIAFLSAVNIGEK